MIAGEIRYVGKETDRKWEEAKALAFWDSKLPNMEERGKFLQAKRSKRKLTKSALTSVLAKADLIGKNFIRKLVRGVAVKRISYNEFVRWLCEYRLHAKLNGQCETAIRK